MATANLDIDQSRPLKILFFIGSLATGGAERQFAQLADALTRRGHQITLATIFPGGSNWEKLLATGAISPIALYSHRANSPAGVALQLIGAVPRLRRLIRHQAPDVLYSALYLSNLGADLARSGPATGPRLVWGIRASNMKLNWKRRLPFYLCRWRSSRVDLLIANSHAGLVYHEQQGFNSRRHVVIPNGIDTTRFAPDPAARLQVQAGWCVPSNVPLVGLVGRLDPMKDHPTFLQAAAQVLATQSQTHFVCVGDGPPAYRAELMALGRQLGLNDRLIWAGARTDMPAVYNALDVLCLSSSGEGFPNVIGEAMACGVPCVATDVGDSARIVGDTGQIVPPGQPAVLAEAIIKLLVTSKNPDISTSARKRITSYFDLNCLTDVTEKTLKSLINSTE